MFGAATDVALRLLVVSIQRVAFATMSFPRGVLSLTFAFAFQVSKDFVLRVEETSASAFALTLTIPFEGPPKVSAKAPNRATRKSSPGSFGVSVLEEDRFGS